MHNSTWILVADAGRARIFSAIKTRLFTHTHPSELTLISEHEHSESRKMDSELVSDRQGHFGSGTFVEQTDPKRHQEDVFALELGKILQHACNENQLHDVILIAPPAFMGMLNKHLCQAVNKLVSLRIEKDYTRDNEQKLIQQLQGYL